MCHKIWKIWVEFLICPLVIMTVTDQSIYIGHLTLTGREVVAEESGRSGTDCGLQL